MRNIANITKMLRLTFVNAIGRNVTISLPQPDEEVTEEEVETVMDEILTKNVFTTTGGDLIAKKAAKIVETSTSELYQASGLE